MAFISACCKRFDRGVGFVLPSLHPSAICLSLPVESTLCIFKTCLQLVRVLRSTGGQMGGPQSQCGWRLVNVSEALEEFTGCGLGWEIKVETVKAQDTRTGCSTPKGRLCDAPGRCPNKLCGAATCCWTKWKLSPQRTFGKFPMEAEASRFKSRTIVPWIGFSKKEQEKVIFKENFAFQVILFIYFYLAKARGQLQ